MLNGIPTYDVLVHTNLYIGPLTTEVMFTICGWEIYTHILTLTMARTVDVPSVPYYSVGIGANY